MNNLVITILLLFAAIPSAIGVTLAKKGIDKAKNLLGLINKNFILGGVSFGFGLLCYLVLLNLTSLTHAYAIIKPSSHIWLMVFSKKILKETIGKKKIIGTGLIVAGIILVSI